eukprot:COSAG01_NODE_1029_length_12019_cov_560.144631_4_plen_215_part_00
MLRWGGWLELRDASSHAPGRGSLDVEVELELPPLANSAHAAALSTYAAQQQLALAHGHRGPPPRPALQNKSSTPGPAGAVAGGGGEGEEGQHAAGAGGDGAAVCAGARPGASPPAEQLEVSAPMMCHMHSHSHSSYRSGDTGAGGENGSAKMWNRREISVSSYDDRSHDLHPHPYQQPHLAPLMAHACSHTRARCVDVAGLARHGSVASTWRRW